MSDQITVELGDVVDSLFQVAVKTLASKELDVAVSFKLMETLKQLKEYNGRHNEQRIKLLEKYTKKRKDGAMATTEDEREFLFSPENRVKFDKEYTKLSKVEVELTPISLSDLAGCKIAPEVLGILMGKVIQA